MIVDSDYFIVKFWINIFYNFKSIHGSIFINRTVRMLLKIEFKSFNTLRQCEYTRTMLNFLCEQKYTHFPSWLSGIFIDIISLKSSKILKLIRNYFISLKYTVCCFFFSDTFLNNCFNSFSCLFEESFIHLNMLKYY